MTVTDIFTAPNANNACTLKIHNGGLEDSELERVSSSIIIFNGMQVVGPNEFNQNVALIEKPITINTSNTLSVEVRGKPGGAINVEVICVDDDLPTITASVDPEPNAAGWNRDDVTVTFECGDAISGIASCADPVPVNTEGAGQVVTGTAVDNAGNTESTSVSINLDKTPPTISASGTPVPNANGWNNTDVTVSFDCSDTLSGMLSCTDPVAVSTEGEGQVITGTATDVAENSAGTGLTLNIDKTPPAINLVEPSDGTTTVPEQACSGSLSEAAALTLNGQAVTVAPDNTFDCGPVTLQEGVNIFQFVATDPAGNAGELIVTVTLEIPAMVTVPHVLYLSRTEAETALGAAGLDVGNITEEYRVTIPTGWVIGQNPDGGAEAPEGSPVDLVLVRQPPVGAGESIPGTWAGEWLVSLSFQSGQGTNTFGVEEITDILCEGDPVGVALVDALAGENPNITSTVCTGSATAGHIEASCTVQAQHDICILNGTIQFSMDLNGDTLTGTAEWTSGGECGTSPVSDHEMISISGTRVSADQSLCGQESSSLPQKFLRLPFNLPLLQGDGI